ncbi:multiple sugar transport system permease protein [Paenibacillus sp. UNCCL117]|uniref:carbohydrate ABC transporter permease n=1 Tax=unclassified Paenibacillus TaxID=185978 RepID=UPI00087EDE3D|nr:MULTISPECIES: carbohydrate ABC transporter permease [unclassified Paenibacillus]SDD96253.1 multiple sugar transport system permease protein [Paenibacillus sp. cl123]SFW56429.1 multiple sugar transport system permease protein [Paenibacillus sp. UNCCL117]
MIVFGKYSFRSYCTAFVAAVVTLVYLFPIYWLFVTSIKPMNELFAYPPHYIPLAPTLEAYVHNFVTNTGIFRYIGNSSIIAAGTMLLTLLLAAPAAYGLARLPIRGKGVVLIVLLATQMLPNIMLAMPLFIMFSKVQLVNSYTALIIANTTHTLPFAVLVLRPYFLGIPGGVEEAALIDGCGKARAFWKIVLPLVLPGLLTVGAISFLWGWGDFIFALTLTSDETVRPLTMGLSKFTGEFGTQWNYLMAVAAIAALPIIVIFASLQKYIVSGLASGSMKD